MAMRLNELKILFDSFEELGAFLRLKVNARQCNFRKRVHFCVLRDQNLTQKNQKLSTVQSGV
jgi:hypothetical protein